ncbi:MAG: molybdenum cofactor guanylyltransferase [Betaproteobacteria bacterium SG8_40]|jgi:molybdopterin-guanine dinucleotide biosynthesis protein A|nr:MAG: molybdenum cofactor guanylyltransferase [Betaproteobacteria bacterium SG8_40]
MSASQNEAERPISGVVLAGGQGRRMGSVDKGLQPFRGRALIECVIERLQPQVAEILVNANQNAQRYAALGYRVITDLVPDYAGPLAGLHSALTAASHELVLTVPCDSPFLPADLAARMQAELGKTAADVAVAWTGSQPHPVFCMTRRALLPHLTRFLDAGGRKIDAWYADLNVARVAFDDQPDAFANFNTLAELRSAERQD